MHIPWCLPLPLPLPSRYPAAVPHPLSADRPRGRLLVGDWLRQPTKNLYCFRKSFAFSHKKARHGLSDFGLARRRSCLAAGCGMWDAERAAAEFEFEIQKAHTPVSRAAENPSKTHSNSEAVRQCPCPAAGHWRKMR